MHASRAACRNNRSVFALHASSNWRCAANMNCPSSKSQRSLTRRRDAPPRLPGEGIFESPANLRRELCNPGRAILWHDASLMRRHGARPVPAAYHEIIIVTQVSSCSRDNGHDSENRRHFNENTGHDLWCFDGPWCIARCQNAHFIYTRTWKILRVSYFPIAVARATGSRVILGERAHHFKLRCRAY